MTTMNRCRQLLKCLLLASTIPGIASCNSTVHLRRSAPDAVSVAVEGHGGIVIRDQRHIPPRYKLRSRIELGITCDGRLTDGHTPIFPPVVIPASGIVNCRVVPDGTLLLERQGNKWTTVGRLLILCQDDVETEAKTTLDQAEYDQLVADGRRGIVQTVDFVVGVDTSGQFVLRKN